MGVAVDEAGGDEASAAVDQLGVGGLFGEWAGRDRRDPAVSDEDRALDDVGSSLAGAVTGAIRALVQIRVVPSIRRLLAARMNYV